jgi:hypothetical protein
MLFALRAIPQGLKAAFILRFIVGDKSPTYHTKYAHNGWVPGLAFETEDAGTLAGRER